MKKPGSARQARATLAAETLHILEQGHYTASDGQRVDIADALAQAVAQTRLIPPEAPLHLPAARFADTPMTLRNETTLAAGRRLSAEASGLRWAILNFASAKNPGGGFLGGSEAQEESLARSSGLYACIQTSPMYSFHRRSGDPLYSDHVIYSPDVPVLREDDGSLLAVPWLASFLTVPAVNAGVARGRGKSRQKIRDTMRARMVRLLTLAAVRGHDAVLLGAWGCGVFRNDPVEVAGLFHSVLSGELRGAFQRVHFAVYDNQNGVFIQAFRQYFPAGDASGQ